MPAPMEWALAIVIPVATLAIQVLGLIAQFGLFQYFFSKAQASFQQTLDIAAARHNVRDENLHARRIEVIDQVYGLLVDTESELAVADTIGAPDAVKLQRLEAWKAIADNWRRASSHARIWLPPEFGKRFDEIWQAIKDAGYAVQDAADPHRTESTLYKSREIMRGKFQPLRAALEAEFRKLAEPGWHCDCCARQAR